MNDEIIIVDYDCGNTGSVINMLKFLGKKSKLSSNPEDLYRAKWIILPGVGKFDSAITSLNNRGLSEALLCVASRKKTPIMGICLGMQVMCKSSEEGLLDGLGLIEAEVKKFPMNFDTTMKMPHMGWNSVRIKNQGSIFSGLKDPRFYFIHSFYVDCFQKDDVIGETEYGLGFVSAFQKDNLVGVQFHPEKSHSYGVEVFRNFLGML